MTSGEHSGATACTPIDALPSTRRILLQQERAFARSCNISFAWTRMWLGASDLMPNASNAPFSRHSDPKNGAFCGTGAEGSLFV